MDKAIARAYANLREVLATFQTSDKSPDDPADSFDLGFAEGFKVATSIVEKILNQEIEIERNAK